MHNVVGNRDILYLYSDRMVKKLIIVSLSLNEFSWGKVQIPNRLLRKPLKKSCFKDAVYF